MSAVVNRNPQGTRNKKFNMPKSGQFIRKFWPLLIAVLFIAMSWLGLQRAGSGLTSRFIEVDGTPMQIIMPTEAVSVPGVAIAHGFSGSKQLMLGYAYTLAHNGYGVLLWDLPGHGANQQPFEYDTLQTSFEIPLATLKTQPEIDPQRLAVLGHSMGAGIAMTGGIEYANDLDAVVAISPMDAAVTAEVPKNLSLQVGEWETWLIPYSQKLLETAGGLNPNLDSGKGRSLSIIPNVEHATILFKDASHQQALDWLNQTFGIEQNSDYRDRRMGWYGLHLLGWILAVARILPRLVQSVDIPLSKPSRFQAASGLVLSPIAGAMGLKLLDLGGSVENMGGLMIGGALGIWFLIAGLVWLGLMAKFPMPSRNDILIGLIGFACLWMGFGAMAQVVWLPWLLTPPRLVLWGLIAIACIPWFLASSLVQQQTKRLPQLGWWLAQSITVILGLSLTLMLLPSLGFLAIMLPVFPLLFGLFSFLATKSTSPWGFALMGAPILSWLIVVPFPVT